MKTNKQAADNQLNHDQQAEQLVLELAADPTYILSMAEKQILNDYRKKKAAEHHTENKPPESARPTDGKTIKQIADELGVSKDKVKYRVRDLPSNFIKKRGNITYITNGGEYFLRSLLGKIPGNFSPVFQELSANSPVFDTAEKQRIRELESEVEKLRWQLEFERAAADEKIAMQKAHHQETLENFRRATEDIEKMHVLLEREQQLRFADKATTIHQLTDGRADPAKPGFFSRIFQRRK